MYNVKETLHEGEWMNNRVEELRKANGMTQQELGKILDVSRQTIISIENGKYNPSLGLAHAIAGVFECTIEEVFLFED